MYRLYLCVVFVCCFCVLRVHVRLQGFHVLLVDDVASNLKIVTMLMKRLGKFFFLRGLKEVPEKNYRMSLHNCD